MNTRSLYGRLDRQDVPGILRVFDIANPDTAVHVRSKTTVPQQSLAVLDTRTGMLTDFPDARTLPGQHQTLFSGLAFSAAFRARA